MIGWRSVFLLQLVILLGECVSSEDVILTVNAKKPIAVVSEKFLSLTLDPAFLLTGDVLTSSTEKNINMAMGLAPAYVRLGGPRSNSYNFERALFPQDNQNDPEFTFSEAHWVLVQQWAARSGLEVIACIAPQQSSNGEHNPAWDPRNALELISFSDHMGYNMSWQLGYECQTRCDIPGTDLGKDVVRLRSMLDAFPRYAGSFIAGPDVVTYRTRQQQLYLQEYLNAAGNSLSAITWHPDFAGITVDSDGVSLQQDMLPTDKEGLYKIVGRAVAKKPLWIAESKPEGCKRQFLGALVWARRLGSAARLGIQVLMRQPDTSNLFQPTPDYWVSILHKMLVGREVLDTKVMSGNRTHVHFYCQCTRPSSKYEKGALTIFGLNLTPAKILANIKGLKIKTLHKYILMPGYDASNRMFAETVLLNNEPLDLVDGKELPEIKPTVVSNIKSTVIKLPSGGIGFWVIPGARVKSCMGHDDDSVDKMLLKKLTKKLEEPDVEEDVGHEDEDEQEIETESGEEKKTFMKQKKKRRKYKHSEEAEDEEPRFKRIDPKKELEKFEKFLKRNHNDDKKAANLKGRVGLTMFDDSTEKKEDISDEEEIILLKSHKLDSGEEIRAKLEEYKNKLIEHENKRKKYEENTKKITDSQDSNTVKDVDTQKAIEALKLISQVESAMKGLDKYEVETKVDTLSNGQTFDLASGLVSVNSENGEELLLDELQKSDKIKRMIDPKSLSKLYHFLLDDNTKSKLHKRDAEEVSGNLRRKRDLDKLFGDDPLGLRREGLFKKRTKSDDAKERRLERKNRKKDKDESPLRKEVQGTLFDPRAPDSNENNFFGFPQQEPPADDFPNSDVYLDTGTSSQEEKADYDYVKDDDDVVEEKKPKRKRKSKNSGKPKVSEPDDTWAEDANDQFYHAPNEFFENVNKPYFKVNDNLKNYGELWEAESVKKVDNMKDVQKIRENDTIADIIVEENHPDEVVDKRAKETAIKKLRKYYDNSDVLTSVQEIDYDEIEPETPKPMPKPKSTNSSKNKSNVKAKYRDPLVDKTPIKVVETDEDYEGTDSMQFVNSRAEDLSDEGDMYEHDDDIDGIGIKKNRRTKRKIHNLNSIFNQEMIDQDVNNFKDCKCRVIRDTWTRKCKNCMRRGNRRGRDVAKEEIESNSGVLPVQSSSDSNRPGRDAEAVQTVESNPGEQIVEIVKPNPDEIVKVSTDKLLPAIVEVVESTTRGKVLESNPDEQIAKVKAADGLPENVEVIQEGGEPVISLDNSQGERIEPLGKANPEGNDDKADIKDEVRSEPQGLKNFRGSQEQPKRMETNLQGTSQSNEGTATLALDRIPQMSETEGRSGNGNGQQKINEIVSSNLSSENTNSSRIPRGNPNDGSLGSNQNAEIVGSAYEQSRTSFDQEQIGSGSGQEMLKVIEKQTAQSVHGNVDTESHLKTGIPGIVNTSIDTKLSANSEIHGGTEKKIVEDKTSTKVTASETTKYDKTKSNSEIKSPKANVAVKKKALEASAKLKAADNNKYLEYQKKRSEKLAALKEKLRARKARILQQYREELLEALSKCDSEVERNLKRRQIWEDLTRHEEFHDFVDKDKLAYLMMNKPIDYDSLVSETYGTEPEDRRYIPEVEMILPLHSAREQKINTAILHHHFHEPKTMHYYNFETDMIPDLLDHADPKGLKEVLSGSEETSLNSRHDDEKSFFALVESMENPKIFHKQHLQESYLGDKYSNRQKQLERIKEEDDLSKKYYNIDIVSELHHRGREPFYEPYSRKLQDTSEKRHYQNGIGGKYTLERQDQLDTYDKNHREHKTHYVPIREKVRDAYSTENEAYQKIPERKLSLEDRDENSGQHKYQDLHQRVLVVDPSLYKGGPPKFQLYEENLRSANAKAQKGSIGYAEEPSRNELYEISKMKYSKQGGSPAVVEDARSGESIVSSPSEFLLNLADGPKSNVIPANEKEFTSPQRIAIDVNMKNVPNEVHENDVGASANPSIYHIDVHSRQYHQKHRNPSDRKEPTNSGRSIDPEVSLLNHHSQEHHSTQQELDTSNEKHVRISRHVNAYNKQTVEEPSFKIVPLISEHKSPIRRGREANEERSNYICLKEDSGEVSSEEGKKLFKLVKEDDHYKAVPAGDVEVRSKHGTKRKKYLKSFEYDENTKYRKPKYVRDASKEDGVMYRQHISKHAGKNIPSRQNLGGHYTKMYDDEDSQRNDEGDLLVNLPKRYTDGIEVRFHEDEDEGYHTDDDHIDNLEFDDTLNPDKYELLMLIPVKSHKLKRHRRQIGNEIERSEGQDDSMNEVWADIVDLHQNEKLLKEYIEDKEKTTRDFKTAQRNMNEYLAKIRNTENPAEKQGFEKMIMNLELPDRGAETPVVDKSDDERDKIRLGEYLKGEILKTIQGPNDDRRPSESVNDDSRIADENDHLTSTSSLFDEAIPKIEEKIIGGLEKVENLTESLENFIDEFDKTFNSTLEKEKKEVSPDEDSSRKKKISYNIFHTALNNVKKFFKFLSGVAHIFHRH